MAQVQTTTSEAILLEKLEWCIEDFKRCSGWCNEDFNRCSEFILKIFEPSSSSSPSPDYSSSSLAPSPDYPSSSLDQQLELESASEASFSIHRTVFYILAPIVVPVILYPVITSFSKHSMLILQVAFDRDTDKIQQDLALIDTRSRGGFSIPCEKLHILDTISCIHRYQGSCFAAYSNVTFLITVSGTLKFPSINSHSDLDMALDSLEYILHDIVMAGKVWWASRHDTKDLSYLRRLRN
ncbi:hypothetical protein RHSIM_Rhsim03G0069300 [Rhododendron simsii]|uniref:Uncharacterized protein n=1 Tax=Rhododendron simsii TaxID=118357 RepID=A0A834LVL2_RHOSS|nr:hypothetical protein RHSIM_Rhsim03G0069300 [Rhododendron simsii]